MSTSIRPPDFETASAFPYGEFLKLGSAILLVRLPTALPSAPNEFFEQFSHGSELLVHDGAIVVAWPAHRQLEHSKAYWVRGSDAPLGVDRAVNTARTCGSFLSGFSLRSVPSDPSIGTLVAAGH